MVTPTLENGDIWDQNLANASIRPFISETDEDTPGSISPVTDDQLSSAPNQIKDNFYGFYNRIKVSASIGVTVNYEGADILLSDGTVVNVSDGSLILPDNLVSYIYVSSAGSVTNSSTLPLTCIPLARATTSSGVITELIDLRYQELEQVKVISLPVAASPWSPGDVKHTLRVVEEPGWLFCDGRTVNTIDYPALFSAIGYTYGGSGATFKIPDLRGRTLIGAGQGSGLSNRTLGSSVGSETQRLSVAELPSHSHSISQSPHSHSISQSPHSHVANNPPHNHGLTQLPHRHNTTYKRSTSSSDFINVGGAELSQAIGDRPFAFTEAVNIDISVNQAQQNTTINPSTIPISVDSSNVPLSVNSQGGGGAFNIVQPSLVCNYLIRTI